MLLLFPVISVMAQTSQVKGIVTDTSGDPLVGVSVIVKGTSFGTQTNIDGEFSLNAKQGDVLKFTYIGFRQVELAVPADGKINLVMEEEATALDEVVVTALGIKREQKALSYNVQTIKGDALTSNKDANFMNSLAGKVAGVNISSSSAGSGSAARVIMRGMKSLSGNDNALYVIDGIPMFDVNTGSESGGTMGHQPGSSSVADINPDDIESMSVLSGPSAAALYGSAAASGVVLITTKKGTEGRARLTYSNTTQFHRAWMTPKFQNTYGNVPGEFTSWGNKLETPSSYDPMDFFQTGVTEINALTLTVGNAKNQTFASAAATNAPGIMPEADYNRYNFSIRNTTNFFNDKLTLDLGASYIIQNNKNFVGSGHYFSPIPALWLFPRGEDFNEVRMFERFDPSRNIMTQYWEPKYGQENLALQNPYWTQKRMDRTARKQRYMFNASLKYDILPWLYVIGRVRVDNQNIVSEQKYYASTVTTLAGSLMGMYGKTRTMDRTTYADIMASMNKNFINNRLNVNIQAGASINDMLEESDAVSGGLNKVPNVFTVGNIDKANFKHSDAEWHDQIQSVFGSVELGWDSQYYLTVTGRNDWASMLAFTDKLSYFYPSVGASWLISETLRDYLPQAISFLKVRGSWAEVAKAPDRYLTRPQFEYFDQTDQFKWPSIHYNPNLKPENTKSWEIGLSAKFLNNTIGLELTYYKANTYNQTFQVDASASSGYEKNLVQTGNIENRGVEAALTYQNQWGDWRFNTGITYSLNRNKVIQLANGALDPETGLPIEMEYYAATSCLGMSGGPAIRLYEGGSMGDLYSNLRLRESGNGYVWKDPATGKVQLEQVDYFKVGSLLPNFNMGWTGTLGWKDLSVSWAVTGRFGGRVISDTQAYLDRYGVSEVSAAARDNGGVPIPGNGVADPQNYYETISGAAGTYYVYDATNVRLADLTISYTLPRTLLKNIADVTLSLTGKNLWMIYCKAPFDPESTSATTNNFYQGIDYFQSPSLRTYGFNVKFTF
ncbi:MAG: SusC/RagA family TonB-linked outer membrane protein [Bacteroides sp.]|nr:SusC/RagA family TonB-linked outer membrane protein [Bacteroides sp.]MCM1413861.1 SusC/RagA family TonB-linked outer membrane protein [Bacteroides sp.]MCM1471030.1 SusC/RagA family TonB-linked outer membrane protein [Bacteroides sp.]